MTTENKTPEEKKAGQMAGCAGLAYGGIVVSIIVYAVYVLIK